MVTFKVSTADSGSRLDHFLKQAFPEVSRREILAWIQGGRVQCDGVVAPKGAKLCAEMQIDVNVPGLEERPAPVVPEDDPSLRVLFEDSALVAVEKPPSCPSHPLHAGEGGTVANILLARYPEMADVGFSSFQPGLVHRLDRDTSGVLLAARKPGAFEALRVQFRRNDVLKIYYAVVHGSPRRAGGVDLPIGTRGRRSPRVVVCDQGATKGLRNVKPAETTYRTVRSFGAFSLVRLVMKTGVRHQLRAHMAHLGHPVAGDRLYGAAAQSFRRNGPVPPRQLLHASEIRFFHPDDGRELRIRCALPPDMRVFMAS